MKDQDARIFTDVQHPFHDDSIYGFKLVPPEPEVDDWNSEFILDMDHITDWIGGSRGSFQFDVAKAALIFKNATDLSVTLSNPGTTMYPLPIDRIDRSAAPVVDHGGFQSFEWTIILNDLGKGSISLTASGYQLKLLSKPLRLTEQSIPVSKRKML